ncbi:hypothetical protein NA57DRAFT_75593 [Rhizodiscina lignyota]|uniref:Uncharacterized protein n=1 Tax=Rhizodiscina lignyota TaxID=1504668 RepID=A0A9P4M7K6_9PEZI|nr:hypothetical protein NA57DRAFT_75593 [Rhizodiscina lignyota]
MSDEVDRDLRKLLSSGEYKSLVMQIIDNTTYLTPRKLYAEEFLAKTGKSFTDLLTRSPPAQPSQDNAAQSSQDRISESTQDNTTYPNPPNRYALSSQEPPKFFAFVYDTEDLLGYDEREQDAQIADDDLILRYETVLNGPEQCDNAKDALWQLLQKTWRHVNSKKNISPGSSRGGSFKDPGKVETSLKKDKAESLQKGTSAVGSNTKPPISSSAQYGTGGATGTQQSFVTETTQPLATQSADLPDTAAYGSPTQRWSPPLHQSQTGMDPETPQLHQSQIPTQSRPLSVRQSQSPAESEASGDGMEDVRPSDGSQR